MKNCHLKEVGMKVNTKVNCIIVDGEILDFNKPKYEITNNFDNFYYKSIIDFFSGKYKKGFYSKYRLDRISKTLISLINNLILSFFFIHNKFENNKINIIKFLGDSDNNSIKAWAKCFKFNKKMKNPFKNKILKRNSKITFKEIINRQIRKVPVLSSYKLINLKSTSLVCINYENLKKSYKNIVKEVYVEDI